MSEGNENSINIYELRKAQGLGGRKWSVQEVQYLIDLLNFGNDINTIAAKLARTKLAIKKKAGKIGLDLRSTKPRAPAWTNKEDRILSKEWIAGTTIENISKRLKRTSNAVRTRRRNLKLPRRSSKYKFRSDIQELYASGVTISQISKKYKMAARTLKKQLRPHAKPNHLSKQEIEIVEERFLGGCCNACIARRIMRSTSTVRRHTEKLDDLSTDVDNLIYDLIKNGLSIDQTCLKMELPRASVIAAYEREKDLLS